MVALPSPLPTRPGYQLQRSIDGDQMGDHRDDLGRRAVGVHPASDLIQVVADAGALSGALALDGDRQGGPGARPRHRLPQQRRHGYCQVEQNPPVLRKDSAGLETENQ